MRCRPTSLSLSWLFAACMLRPVDATSTAAFQQRQNEAKCQKTTVAILGAGVTGITAAQALTNQSITDFLIVEVKDHIGGRMAHTNFGKKPDGTPYVIELGANWVQGLGTEGGPENPIWTFAKKYNITNTYSNYSSLLTYDETGYVDYMDLINQLDDVISKMDEAAGVILSQNLQDMSARAGFSLAGWKPRKDMHKQAAEWWDWDFETAYTPEESSFVFGVAGNNLTFNQFSDENNFVLDQRGFNAWLIGIASTFLKPNDKRLLLNTNVTTIEHSNTGVTVRTADGKCISAAYALCTFSLGVLQNEVINFSPTLPLWKRTAIETFDMGTYTKIFLQFPTTFWDPNTQFFLYADPDVRGRYPIWQSLSTEGFLPGSNIIFVTVTGLESYRVEAQTDEETKAEIMVVLRKMFPNVTVPDPVAFTYPRWSLEPWVYGSYSNWPVGVTLEQHQNLRANVGRLFFAGEHTSAEYYGFLHGGWFEGREAGERLAGHLGKECRNGNGNGTRKECGEYKKYEVLHGTTRLDEYNGTNGWWVSSFYTAPGSGDD